MLPMAGWRSRAQSTCVPSQTCAPVHESSAQSSAHNLCVFATVPGCEVQVYGHHGYMLQPVESLRLSGNFIHGCDKRQHCDRVSKGRTLAKPVLVAAV